MTGRAVDVEAVVAAFDIGLRNLNREEGDVLPVLLARIPGLITP